MRRNFRKTKSEQKLQEKISEMSKIAKSKIWNRNRKFIQTIGKMHNGQKLWFFSQRMLEAEIEKSIFARAPKLKFFIKLQKFAAGAAESPLVGLSAAPAAEKFW